MCSERWLEFWKVPLREFVLIPQIEVHSVQDLHCTVNVIVDQRGQKSITFLKIAQTDEGSSHVIKKSQLQTQEVVSQKHPQLLSMSGRERFFIVSDQVHHIRPEFHKLSNHFVS